jgi:hypothetical protein
VLLNYDEHGVRHVGYIANMHTQAFQGSEAVLLSQLTDAVIFVSLFKEQTTQPRDIIDFDIVCGDFNADNMSPGKVRYFVCGFPYVYSNTLVNAYHNLLICTKLSIFAFITVSSFSCIILRTEMCQVLVNMVMYL